MVANGGVIRSAVNAQSITITMTGDVTVHTGGQIVANADITAANFTLQAGATINAKGLGYLGGRQPGNASGTGQGPAGGTVASDSGGGGGHGGAGGRGAVLASTGGAANGTASDPTDFGSGGGGTNYFETARGGNGGGRVRITAASGSATISGTIDVDGNAPAAGSGGGAGGTIRITAATIAGAGTLNARGGRGSSAWQPNGGGGGGGGRVYISTDRLFGGLVRFEGGGHGGLGNTAAEGAYSGAGGSYHAVIPSADAICDSGTFATTCTISTTKTLPQNQLSLSGSNLVITSSGGLTVREYNDWLALDFNGGTVQIDGTLTANVSHLRAASVSVGSTGVWTGNVGGPNAGTHPGIYSTGTFTVAAGGLISADAQGYAGGMSFRANGATTGFGPGGGVSSRVYENGGGGHGGAGGNGNHAAALGGVAYGSAADPSDYGSGGGGYVDGAGGNGGGMIRVEISGLATIDGVLSAEGSRAQPVGSTTGAGGAGGSIKLAVGSVSGAGTLRVRGGAAGNWAASGGGGGGRIAILRAGGTAFAGTTQVTGGSGNGAGSVGAAGTVHNP